MAPVVRAVTILALIAVNLRTLLGAFGAAGMALGEQLPGGGAAVGLTSTISIALIAVGAPISALVTKRRGIDDTVLVALLATAISLALVSLDAPPATWAAAVVGGLAAGVLGALLPALAQTWLPRALGTAVGIMMAATSAGLAIASILVSSSLERQGSWSLATAALALVALVAALAYRREARRRSAVTHMPASLPLSEPPADDEAASAGRRGLPRWARVLTAFLAVQSFVLFAQIAWLAPSLETTGATAGLAGAMLGLFSVLQVVAALASTHHAQRRGHLGLLVIGASLLTVVGTTALTWALVDGRPIAMWSVGAMSLGHGASFALANLAIAQRSSDPGAAARTGGIVMFVSQGIGALGPVTVGALRDSAAGFGGAWLLLAVLTVAQAAFALVYLATERASSPTRVSGQRKRRPSSRR